MGFPVTAPGAPRRASCIVALAIGLAVADASAQANPVGLWKTFDEDTGAAKSLIRIRDSHGVLEGRIEKLLDPGDPPDAVCDRCTDERRNKPLVGLVIIRNVRKSDGQAGRWDGGDILDPEEGKTYSVRFFPGQDGRRMEVRGFIGTPFLGRTQTWLRVE